MKMWLKIDPFMTCFEGLKSERKTSNLLKKNNTEDFLNKLLRTSTTLISCNIYAIVYVYATQAM